MKKSLLIIMVLLVALTVTSQIKRGQEASKKPKTEQKQNKSSKSKQANTTKQGKTRKQLTNQDKSKDLLESMAYEVSFTCNVSTACMFLDGDNYGSPSGTRYLKAGIHNVKLTAEGYQDIDTTIDVMKDNISIRFDMVESQNGKMNNYSLSTNKINRDLIEKINLPPESYLYDEGKKNAEVVTAFMGLSEESLIANDEIMMSFDDITVRGKKKGQRDQYFNIVLTNISNKVLYIDRSSCFYMDNNNSIPFYNPNGVGNSKSVISIEASLTNAELTVNNNMQIVTLPPNASVVVAYGCRIPLFQMEYHSIKMGQIISCTYETSPVKWSYYITYSHQKDFSSSSNLTAKAYCRYVLGLIGDVSVLLPTGIEIYFSKELGARTDFLVRKKETIYNIGDPFWDSENPEQHYQKIGKSRF